MVDSDRSSIVVLGAGVVGLTTALTLARQGHRNIVVVARDMPGDRAFKYTSIWAGVNWASVAKEEELVQWDRVTWHELKRLADEVPGAGVWLQGKTAYARNKERTVDQLEHWFKDLVPDYRILTKEEVPPFADWGLFYRTIGLDPSIYLHYLQSTCLSVGVKFRRACVAHIRDAFTVVPPEPDLSGARATQNTATFNRKAAVVVNCTGVSAKTLGGVMDENIVPVRGQLVIVENESHGQWSVSGDDDIAMDKSIGECCYIIDRPAGGGTALGGSYYHTESSEPDMALADRIMRRSIKVCPHLIPPGCGIEALHVIRHQVGLRPVRVGGPRIELEVLDGDGRGLPVVHCYGMGGFGFQSSYGVAAKAASLVREALGTEERWGPHI